MTSTSRDPGPGLLALACANVAAVAVVAAVLGWRSAAAREELASRDPVGSRQ